MSALEHPAADEVPLQAVVAALSDPVRQQIVQLLATRGELSTHTVNAALPLSRSTVSQHLRVLREAGVTITRAQGRQRLVSLRRDVLDRRFRGMLEAALSLHRSA